MREKGGRRGLTGPPGGSQLHAGQGKVQLFVASILLYLDRKTTTRAGQPGRRRHRRLVKTDAKLTMKMIQANCRVQFAAEDIEFILSVLGGKIGTAECLVKLLADEESRDLILDDEALLHALLERRGCLRVSSRFYFYILVRNVFRRADIQDRAVADYVAEVLAEFSSAERARCVVPGQNGPLDYFFEMLAALKTADERTGFFLRAHIGNYSLFLSGVFPDRIRFRAEARGFPDLKYYEALGRTQYRMASDHRLARRFELTEILGTLSERFKTSRLALNDIADRLFSLGDTNYALDTLLTGKNDPEEQGGWERQ